MFVQLLLTLSLVYTALSATPSERAAAMVANMNLTEKLTMMHGHYGQYVGNIYGNDRLGIPPINMQDGPQGFRTTKKTGGDGTTTAWPSALSITASWDSTLMYNWANAMATEFKNKGANVALAPGIGIARVSNAGRNFEYMCGEDPTLGATLVGSVVTGIQDTGIIANAKHWINNEIEDERMRVSSNVNERVRFELYYPPFQAAIDAGVLSVMCAYNRINNVHACENNDTLSHLKDTMGFQGWVMSDWTATHSTTNSLLAGLDQEMPMGLYYNENRVQDALDAGEVSMENIDNSVTRILTSMYAIGMFDAPAVGDPMANVTSEAHNQLAREIAAVSTVLAKNTGDLLPLSKDSLGECVAVFGDETTVSGGGSGHVNPAYIITPAQGISNAISGSATEVIYNAGTDLTEATELAKKCSTAVVVVATSSAEGSDRENLSLGNNQDELVSAIAAANPRTIVSVRSPGAVLMPWVSEVPAVLLSWLAGQEAGNGLADVLFGEVNPSARSPVTMPNKDNEVGFTEVQYPGVGQPPEARYLEELLIGYRWYDANQVTPVFPFGHGLSYTTFSYNSMSIERSLAPPTDLKSPVAEVTVKVTNTGKRDGSEVVQLYLAFPHSAAGEPPKQLKAFSKVAIRASETVEVKLTLTQRDVSIWDSDAHAWAAARGEFNVLVGASASAIRLNRSFLL